MLMLLLPQAADLAIFKLNVPFYVCSSEIKCVQNLPLSIFWGAYLFGTPYKNPGSATAKFTNLLTNQIYTQSHAMQCSILKLLLDCNADGYSHICWWCDAAQQLFHVVEVVVMLLLCFSELFWVSTEEAQPYIQLSWRSWETTCMGNPLKHRELQANFTRSPLLKKKKLLDKNYTLIGWDMYWYEQSMKASSVQCSVLKFFTSLALRYDSLGWSVGDT